ncbi:MAG: fibronectin type III domain-containing protein [Thermodesulfobacteriota bacterium]
MILSLLSLSCGKKTDPVPLHSIPPAPISSLSYELDDKGVTLSWSLPTTTSPSSFSTEIKEFLVERAAYDVDDFCPDCPLRYGVIAIIPAREDQQLKYSYSEEELTAGYIYYYRIKTALGWRFSGSSSEAISFTWQEPLGPPTELESAAGDGIVALTWLPPAADLAGNPLSGPLNYQVYRSVAGNNFHPIGDLQTTPAFQDRQVTSNVSYQYRVKASRLSGGSGAVSDIIEATPQDATAPPPPEGLEAIPLPQGIRLSWNPSAAEDLAGYQIFRRAADEPEQTLTIVGRVTAPLTTFVDKPPEDIQVWYYAVKAFDRATPSNTSPFSAEIKTERN